VVLNGYSIGQQKSAPISIVPDAALRSGKSRDQRGAKRVGQQDREVEPP
jgi:hypothetical protein